MTTSELPTSRAFIDHASQFLLGDYLPKIERCLEKLSDEQIWWRANEESNSIGNLILHLCGNARQWIICGVGAKPDNRDRDAEFAQRETVPRDELLTLLRSTLVEVHSTLLNLDPSLLLEHRKIQGNDVEILEAIFHVTEHFSMHAGQIIMLTKMFTSSDLRFYDLKVTCWLNAGTRHARDYGVAGLGGGGILNFESSTGAFNFVSVNVRVEVGFPSSSVAARAVNGNFSPSASR